MADPKYRIQHDTTSGLYYAEEFKTVYPEDSDTPIGLDKWVPMANVEASANLDAVRQNLQTVVIGPQTVVTFDKDLNRIS